jgi:DNA polymerase-3 subunit alpha
MANRLAEARRLGREPDQKAYQDRAERELDVIIRLGFDAYYLVVRDFIAWARQHDIPVGPGRGSGAGSLVAFAVGITDIDPMLYDLLFERFLNAERISPPDFDIDFCMESRDQVIQYVTERYGRERVCQIITFNAMKAKAVIRDGSRVLGLTFQEGDAIAKLIPEAVDMTLAKAWSMEPRLQELINGSRTYKTLWDVALRLEGLARQPGKHAAGVVIADRPIEEYAPLFVTDDGSVVTQFNMKDLDYVGLIKFDFLGLTALTVTSNAVKTIRARGNPSFRIEDVPLDDRATFDLICTGATAGVFQLETRGITELVRRLRPDRIEDIIAIIALFRPGPLGSGMDKEFIAVKHGEKTASYPIPELQPILQDTYGTILYQEQVILITSRLAGFSLGQSDILRRAMGKKDLPALQEQREPFLAGCAARGIDVDKASDLFKNMEYFAEYGFNKSHSAAYAYVTYRMAYLKAHYSTEFLCAVLTAEKGDQAKVMRFIHEARLMGVPVLPPDVNSSTSDFTVEDTDDGSGSRKAAIRFGLTAVKGIGTSAVEAIQEARDLESFSSVTDFLSRVDTRKVNKRVIEALARCGAMDGFGHTRAAIVEGLDILLSNAVRRREERDSGQGRLFDALPVSKAVDVGPPHVPEWPDRQRLAYEREAIGYYISGHPLDRFAGRLERFELTPIGDMASLNEGESIRIAGIVLDRNDKVGKASGNRFAYLTIEDATGQVECFVGGRTLPQLDALTDLEDPVLIAGNVHMEGEDQHVRLTVNSIERLEAARKSMAKAVVVRVDMAMVRDTTIDSLREVARRFKGSCPLELRLRLPDVGELTLRAGMQWQVNPCDEIILEIERLLGPGTASLT